VKAIVNLGPVDDPLMPDEASFADWDRRIARDVKSFFPVLKVAADDLAQGGVVIAASAMGGVFARHAAADEPKAWPAPAGNIGLMKCLSLEWTGCRFKAVDLDPAQGLEAQAAALFSELFLPGGRREVGYPAGVRTVFRTEPASLARANGSAREPTAGWVVLAVGGARGVTAETLRDVARSGATLVLVGRSGAPSEEPAVLKAFADKAALQKHFIAQARESGTKISPAAVDAACARVLRDRETRANLADFTALGAKIDCRAADMRDGEAVKTLIASLYAHYGRIDAVLYGAGLIEDQLLVNKTADSVARVIGAKTDGVFHLAREINAESLKFFGLFTSVAGRYGNRGQTDYGAANEILNQYACQLQAQWGPAVKVAAINWGPWAGTTHGAGMVGPEARRQFEARGVSLIEPGEGLDFMTHEIIHAPTDEVEIVAGAHPWEYKEAEHGALNAGAKAGAADPRLERLPLLARRAEIVRGESGLIVRKRVDLVSDPYLDHHRIDGKPVMPFVVGAEHIAEAAQLIDGFGEGLELRDIKFFKGVTLSERHADIEIRLTENAGALDAEIWVVGDKPVRAYAAQVSKAPAALVPSPERRAGAASPVTAQDAYGKWLFHGPLFQTVTRYVSLDPRGLAVEAQASRPGDFYPPAAGTAWTFDPGVLDGALQTVLVWSRVMRDETCLPTRLGRLVRTGSEPLTGPVMIDMTFRTEAASSLVVCDFTVADASGRIRYIVEKMEGASTGALNRIGGVILSGRALHG
ncbi:MAG: SDR family NAD(P)-dependent oxidoreductase, partial [Parvularculaceae bacterium]